jgi:uncharacterized damage-inducible protein DinB
MRESGTGALTSAKPVRILLMTFEELLAAWRTNDAINHELLELCSDEDLDLKPGKGKTIRSNFVHMINVRRYHLEDKLRKESASVPKLDWKTAARDELHDALHLTHDLMADCFTKIEASPQQTKWTVPLFFGYSIAHEAHHRSQIEMSLRLNGREPEDAALYRLWEWPKK